MNTQRVLEIYDARYASAYDNRFLLGEHYHEATAFEVSLLGTYLRPSDRWLDVACGTGYFLAQFPHIERCGLDVSPAMLAQARIANPGVPFVEGDFRDPHEEWRDRWDFVSCMWWSYCYAGSVAAIEIVMRNLAAWTSPSGTCFVPVCDPEELCKTEIPCRDGGTEIAAVVWNWKDQRSGIRHNGLIAPHLDHLVALFQSLFTTVELIDYPAFSKDAVDGTRRAIRAAGCR